MLLKITYGDDQKHSASEKYAAMNMNSPSTLLFAEVYT